MKQILNIHLISKYSQQMATDTVSWNIIDMDTEIIDMDIEIIDTEIINMDTEIIDIEDTEIIDIEDTEIIDTGIEVPCKYVDIIQDDMPLFRKSGVLNLVQETVVRDAIALTKDVYFGGSLLHLPMGSGKTRTSFELGLNLYDQTLIIVSKSLICNWIDELRKVYGSSFQYEIVHRDYLGKNIDDWSPSPRSRFIFTTPETILKSYKLNDIEKHFIRHDPNLDKTIYYNLPKNGSFIPESHEPKILGPRLFHALNWKGIFIDECQNYTNALTSTCRAIASLYCKHRWLLSGTPIQEPNPARLLGLFLLLNYSTPNSVPQLVSWVKSGTFKGIKAYSLTCEAPKINASLSTSEHSYDMSECEAKVFHFFQEIIMKWLEYYDKLKISLPPKSPVLNKVRGHLLSLLTYTRISLTSPKQAITALMDKITTEPMFLGLSETLTELKTEIDNATDYSSRLKILHDILGHNIDKRVIVFSNFVVTLESARQYLSKQAHSKSRSYYIMTNNLSTTQRAAILNDFRKDTNGVLFMTYNMGSEGLNLQCATEIVLLDLYWNSEKENQAIARAYRLGQTSDVTAHYIVSNLAFEQLILKKQIAKTALSKEYMNGSEYLEPKLKTDSLSYFEMLDMITNEDVKLLLNTKRQSI